MKVARQKGVETIINPAPAVPLPEEAYHGLGHLIVNETEAAILSGIEKPQNWNKVAAVFIARGVKNVIITLGGEVNFNPTLPVDHDLSGHRASFTRLQSSKPSPKMELSYRRARSKSLTQRQQAIPLQEHIPSL
jgi:hypothetical protein